MSSSKKIHSYRSWFGNKSSEKRRKCQPILWLEEGVVKIHFTSEDPIRKGYDDFGSSYHYVEFDHLSNY